MPERLATFLNQMIGIGDPKVVDRVESYVRGHLAGVADPAMARDTIAAAVARESPDSELRRRVVAKIRSAVPPASLPHT